LQITPVDTSHDAGLFDYPGTLPSMYPIRVSAEGPYLSAALKLGPANGHTLERVVEGLSAIAADVIGAPVDGEDPT